MNFFADQLTRELDSLGTPRSELATRFGISPSNLSQFCSGKESCGPKQLAKILRNIDAESAIRVAAAWLKDQIPREIDAGSISVTPVNNRVSEKSEWPDTDKELKEALIRLIKKANRHQEVREAILTLAKILWK